MAQKATLRHPLLSFVTAEQIATWAGVTLKSARQYKAGSRRPSRQILRIIALYRAERVLEGPWAHWTVRDDCLVDPHGNYVTAGQIMAYVLVIQHAAELARQAGPEAQERHYRLLAKAG